MSVVSAEREFGQKKKSRAVSPLHDASQSHLLVVFLHLRREIVDLSTSVALAAEELEEARRGAAPNVVVRIKAGFRFHDRGEGCAAPSLRISQSTRIEVLLQRKTRSEGFPRMWTDLRGDSRWAVARRASRRRADSARGGGPSTWCTRLNRGGRSASPRGRRRRR